MATRYDIVSLDSVPSTQDEATRRFAATGRPVLVVTGEQTAGRGRSGRQWLPADRAVAASLAFAPSWEPARWGLIPLATAVAVREAVGAVAGVAAGLKWPNDVLTDTGKVAGILAEAAGDVVTVGCGINLYWPDPPSGAASLYEVEPETDVGRRLATGWADRLLAIVDEPPDEWPRAAYLSASVTIGAGVRWDGGAGTAVDVTGDGALIVDTTEGRVVLHSGEVHLVR